jgi:hypothetical protein
MLSKFRKKIVSSILLFIVTFVLIANPTKVLAQATSGTLKFSPASITFGENDTKNIAIVWEGPGIDAAKVVINVGTGLEIVKFNNPGGGISFLIDSPETGSVHLGKLTEGQIESGTTLFTMDVKSTSCNQNGDITFSTESLVPDMTLSFQKASYTVNCAGGGAPPPGVTNLPKTAIISDEHDKYLFASILVSSGFGILYLAKMFKNQHVQGEDSVELVVRS